VSPSSCARTSEAVCRPKYIVNHVRGTAERTLLDPGARDNITEPYIKLQRRCAEYGYAFQGVSHRRLDECKWIVFWDAWDVGIQRGPDRAIRRLKAKLRGESSRDVFAEALNAHLQDRMVLVMFEPPSVCSRNFDTTLHQHFKVVLTWDPTFVDGGRYHRIYIPNPTDFPCVTMAPFSQRKLLVDISGYKFSSHERELYTERRRLVRFFEQHYPSDFDLYGEDWNLSLRKYLARRVRDRRVRWEFYPSYRGTVRHKWEIYPRYKFGVCYENVLDQPGYVSIKIFDCMRAGCVPIYLGAPDIATYVDAEAFIDRRNFQSHEELAEYMAGMSEREHTGYLEAGKRYLASERFKPFLSEHFVDTVVHVLGLAS